MALGKVTMDFNQRRRVTFQNAPAKAAQRSAPSSTGRARNLRKNRGAALFQALHRLDAAIDEASRAELARAVRDAYEFEIGDIPLGCVAQCFLGPPYVDHVLDLGHAIVAHYAPGDVMPEPFAQARMLVRTGAYAFVEVYISGTIVPVLTDGTAVA